MTDPALDIADLTVAFRNADGVNVALDKVSLAIAPGEIFALVGESGSGKSSLANAVLGLHARQSATVTASRLRAAGVDVLTASDDTLRRMRGAAVSLVPQEPMRALNPTRRAGRQITDVLRLHRPMNAAQAKAEAFRLLGEMGVQDADRVLRAYPFELSGGLRQRVLLAMAFACRPSLLIADEATTALDVTIQAQVLDIVRTRAKQDNVAVLFITHNLALAWALSDHILVLRRGVAVEQGRTRQVLSAPAHQYTRRLLAAMPERHARRTLLPIESTP